MGSIGRHRHLREETATRRRDRLDRSGEKERTYLPFVTASSDLLDFILNGNQTELSSVQALD